MVSWRPLREADRVAVAELARACLAADGGQPFADSPGFLDDWYFAGPATYSGWDEESLVCVAALRPAQASDAGRPAPPVTTGLVHPAHRRRGLGGEAFDWAAAQAVPDAIGADTETLSDGAHALYLSRGLTQVFAEHVMQLAAAAPAPTVPRPAGLTLQTWGQGDPERFHAVYSAAFRERPGFQDWTRERWISWIAEDEDFRPELTLLATLAGADAGHIIGEASGWIYQLGVVPAARGKGVGAALLSEVIERMRASGETAITLNVNVDNPYAAALYRRLGFVRTGGRARYRNQRGQAD